MPDTSRSLRLAITPDFIAKVLRSTVQATYLTDLVVVGRGGAVDDRQPSWRP